MDGGFDLEPEIDSGWWRLRSSGTSGVAWVRSLSAGDGALLALPLASQLAELDLGVEMPSLPATESAALPTGAAAAAPCASPQELSSALRKLWTLRLHAPARLKARWDASVAAALAPTVPGAPTLASTEAVTEVRRRIGQDLYREALLDYWEGRCAVTGLAVPELLRASHAKPWAVSADAERLDVHNGLLLAVHLDALFDRGLLTFDESGRGLLSGQLTSNAAEVLGLSGASLKLRYVRPAHLPYLAYHRASVFRP